MDARPSETLASELEEFAAEVAHELRTPLAALSGEVELALRRERSPAAYRDALSRIAVSVAELVDLTGDLAALKQPPDGTDSAGRTARLDAVLAQLAERYCAATDDVLVVETAATGVAVAGDEALLVRALTLVLQHAVRHRRGGTPVRLRAAPPENRAGEPGAVDLVVDAAPSGFWPHAWQFLIGSGTDRGNVARPMKGSLRLRTAERIVREGGGSLRVATDDGLQLVQIRLRCVEAV